MPSLEEHMDLDKMLRSPQTRHHLTQPPMQRALRRLLERVRKAGQLLPRPEPSASAAAGAPAAQPQWVHGDLRLANILGPTDGGGEEPVLFLIDYDWAGVAGESVYQTEDINSELGDDAKRPAGVRYQGIMCTEHDVQTLEADYFRCGVKLGTSPDAPALLPAETS